MNVPLWRDRNPELREKCMQLFKLLVEKGANLDYADGYTTVLGQVLTYLVYFGESTTGLNLLKFIIGHGCNVNIQTENYGPVFWIGVTIRENSNVLNILAQSAIDVNLEHTHETGTTNLVESMLHLRSRYPDSTTREVMCEKLGIVLDLGFDVVKFPLKGKEILREFHGESVCHFRQHLLKDPGFSE